MGGMLQFLANYPEQFMAAARNVGNRNAQYNVSAEVPDTIRQCRPQKALEKQGWLCGCLQHDSGIQGGLFVNYFKNSAVPGMCNGSSEATFRATTVALAVLRFATNQGEGCRRTRKLGPSLWAWFTMATKSTVRGQITQRRARYSSDQGNGGPGRSFQANDDSEWALTMRACRTRRRCRKGSTVIRVIFGFRLLFVSDSGGAVRKWSLPSACVDTPVAVFGAFGVLCCRIV